MFLYIFFPLEIIKFLYYFYILTEFFEIIIHDLRIVTEYHEIMFNLTIFTELTPNIDNIESLLPVVGM